MTTLKKDGYEHPIYHAVIIFLLSVAAFCLPAGSLFSLIINNGVRAERLATITVRLIVIVISIILIIKYGFFDKLKSFSLKGFLLILPAFLVAINNAPLFSLFSGSAKLNSSAADIAIYAVYCFSIGASEELVFIGLIFPLVSIALKNKNNSIIKAALITAAAFSLSHAINILGGAGIVQTLVQVLYTFLIGGMCIIVVLYAKNLLVVCALHGIYDFGGLMLEKIGIGSGKYFTTEGIIITVILGVLVGVYMLFLLIKENAR